MQTVHVLLCFLFHLLKPSRRDRDTSGGHPSAVVLVYQLSKPLSQLGVLDRLTVDFLFELLVGGYQQAAVVCSLVQDVQLGSLVNVCQGGHAVLQLVVVVFQVDSPLPLHSVVEVPDLSALVLRALSTGTTAAARLLLLLWTAQPGLLASFQLDGRHLSNRGLSAGRERS